MLCSCFLLFSTYDLILKHFLYPWKVKGSLFSFNRNWLAYYLDFKTRIFKTNMKVIKIPEETVLQNMEIGLLRLICSASDCWEEDKENGQCRCLMSAFTKDLLQGPCYTEIRFQLITDKTKKSVSRWSIWECHCTFMIHALPSLQSSNHS